MNEEFKILQEVALRLESAGIEYMMTGSMAMAFYSIPRMTRDIDIIIQASVADVEKIVALFREDFYIEKESVRYAISHRSMFNIIHNESVVKVDLIICKDEDYRIEEFSRRSKLTVEGTSVSVVTPEDLILSKLVWAKQSQSEMQLRDVRQIFKAEYSPDLEYLKKWARKLGVFSLLIKATENE